MTRDHTWHVVIPNVHSCGEGKIFLDDEEMEIPVTEMTMRIKAGEVNRIWVSVIPRGLDALLAFGEENPLAVEVHWPQCPHCGKFYNEEVDSYASPD